MKVSIIGSGIVGLAHALAFAKRGFEVNVYERHGSPMGASIRNFGSFWSIGQENRYLSIASKTKEIWNELIIGAGIEVVSRGSLIVANSEEENNVLKEFYGMEASARNGLKLLNHKEVIKSHVFVKQGKLFGALKSEEEFVINPRKAIPRIIAFLRNNYQVKFHFNHAIQFVSSNYLAAEDSSWESDIIIVCNGSDFETLYPHKFRSECMEKCHLQMMKASTNVYMQLGTTICSGLSLVHYPSFSACPSLPKLKEKLECDFSEYIKDGIHVLITQNDEGDLIIGDSHLYDNQPQPFIEEYINQNILLYLNQFLNLPDFQITQRWTGTYATHPEHKHFFEMIDENVWISTGFGGAGMTLGLGQAEEHVARILKVADVDGKEQNYPLAI
ncbi:MAG: TIGR03364 family FAD-dependent oxidoreductase [Cytophagales bacterium]|nr:TIGR03364 family FAD-dependent oxidoreductase [Cytophagales bacterium]